MAVTIDCGITEQFFAIMLGEGWADVVLMLQSFDDDKDRMTREAAAAKAAGKRYVSPRAAVLVGTWAEIRRRACVLAEDGCCISWTLQMFEGKRKDDDAFFRSIRMLGLDFDDKEPPIFPLVPHAITESSPGRFHVYFRVAGFTRTDFDRAMAYLVAKYGADPSSKDVTKCLRLPGFLHQKKDTRKPGKNGQPYLVSPVSLQAVPAYTVQEIFGAFAVESWEKEQTRLVEEKKIKTRAQSYPRILPSSRPQNLTDIRQALEHVTVDDRQTWLAVGMALASLRESTARELWDEWSQKSEKFEPYAQDMAWDSFRENRERVDDPEKRIGIGTLFHLAREGGWKPGKAWGWRQQLLLSGRGEPTETLSNLMLILENHDAWRGRLWWDQVRAQAMLDDDIVGEQRVGEIALWMGTEERLPIRNVRLLEMAIRTTAEKNARDPILEWLSSLPPWDEKPRLGTWLSDICATDDTMLSRCVSCLIPVSMVARAVVPGCIYRYVVILEGPEEIGKSRLVRALGQEWYVNLSMGLESKEAHLQIQGSWIAELTELDSLSRSEESRIKAFITMTQDDFVPKYSNVRKSSPRRTIFIGTTNEGEYLRGLSGNTRFIPVQILGDIDIDGFRRVRDQVFAEAIRFYRDHPDNWWVLDEESNREAKETREQRRIENVYEQELSIWLEVRTETSWSEIAQYFLRIETPEKWKDKALQGQIGAAMRALGWQRKLVRRDGSVKRLWISSEWLP